MNNLNQTLWTADEILSATHGVFISGSSKDLCVNGVSYFLSRLKPGHLFILTSPHRWGKKYTDLSDHIPEIIQKGANIVITDKPLQKVPKDYPIIQVKDTFDAIKNLGIYARNRFQGTVVCITGSVGKSSVKECLHYVLSKQGLTHKTIGNFNCQRGLPLSLSQTPKDYEYAVFESSLAYFGQSLAKFKSVRPHIAIITDIQPDHLQFCPSLEEIADNKAKIFDALEPNGIAILNFDNPFYERLKEHAIAVGVKKFITFGSKKEADCRLIDCRYDLMKSDIKASIFGKEIEYSINMPGQHMVINSLAVIAGAIAAGLDPEQAAANLSTMHQLYQHTHLEMIPYQKSKIFLIDDTYNSNPASVKAGCEYANLVSKKYNSRTLLVLGDMQELGEQSEKLHADLAQILIDNHIQKVFLIGKLVYHLWEKLPNEMRSFYTPDNVNELCQALISNLKENDTVLVKTSARSREMVPILELFRNLPSTLKKRIPPFKRIDLSNKENHTLTLLLVGDTGHGENYQENIARHHGINILNQMGYDYPLRRMTPILENCDEVIANLETPLTDMKSSPFAKKKSYIHKSDIEKAPESLLKNHIQIVSLANNHAYDYGQEGFNQTLTVLSQNGFIYFGGGENENEADEPLIYELNYNEKKVYIAIIGGFEESQNYRTHFNCYAKKEKSGVSSFNSDKIKNSISKLRKLYKNIYIILYPHWGKNYEWKSSKQTKLAEYLIQSGADLIIGHGSHLLQEIERIEHRWVIYSLGNFMFNSPGRYQLLKAHPFSMAAKIKISVEQNEITLITRLYPIVTDNLKTKYQSRPVDVDEFNEVCHLLENQKVTLDSHLHALTRGRDNLGYYLELPKEFLISESVGMICNIHKEINPMNSPQFWVFRAWIMDKILKENQVRLMSFSPNDINLKSRKAYGYLIEEGTFVKTLFPIPSINYLWYMSSNKKSLDNLKKYILESNKMHYHNYPNNDLIKLTDDKYLSFIKIETFQPNLHIYTEIYNQSVNQVECFFTRSPIIFLKPRYGGSGNGIIVIKKYHHYYIANRYEDQKIITLQKETLEEILLEIFQGISTQYYIIQTGINVPLYQGAKFDIRMTILNDGQKLNLIYESRLGKFDSDVSNISQGGTPFDSDVILRDLFGLEESAHIIQNLTQLSYQLVNELEKEYDSIIEISIDWVIDSSKNYFINEIQTHPGISGHPHLFRDFFHRTEHENTIFNRYTLIHGECLAKFLLSEYLKFKKSYPAD